MRLRNAISLKFILNLTIISELVCIISANSISAFTQEDIIGIWLFDEKDIEIIKDSSGNGHDGEIFGNLKRVEGKFGSGLEFPGSSNSFGSVKHSDDLNLKTYSLVAWARVTADTGDYQCIVGKEEPFSQGNYSLFINKDSHAPVNEFWHAGVYRGVGGKTNIIDNKWHHVAGTYDQKSLKLYFDGILEREMTVTDNPDTTPGVLRFGVRVGGGNPFKGTLDEVGLFNVAISSDDVKNIIANGLFPKSAVSSSDKIACMWGSIKVYCR
jgi:hypothetical protein